MSGADAASNAGAGAVRAGFELDEPALERWLEENVEGFRGPLRVQQFKGGQSNPTYRLDTPEARYVLRRKPPGELLKGAHAVEREARVQQALAGTGVPVARIFGLCTDPAVLGTPFYVMQLVEGRIFWDATFSELPHADRAAYFDAMNATLAGLHSVDPAACGLSDYGRPGNYIERQLAVWSRQYHADTDAGRDPGMDALIDWLGANMPAPAGHGIVHADFRCDNLVFHPSEPRVIAILDWELSTLGDPLADFASHTAMYRIPPEIVAGLGGADIASLGIPSEQDYVRAYCARTGRTGIANWEYYMAFSLFRLAAIFHGIRGRVIRGTAASEHARDRASRFPQLVQLATGAMENCR